MINQICPCCASPALVAFDGETFRIRHSDLTAWVMNLSGSRCTACREVILTEPSAARYAAGGEALVEMAQKRDMMSAAA